MKRIGQITGQNSSFGLLVAGKPYTLALPVAGDTERFAGIIPVNVEIQNVGPQAVIQINCNFPSAMCCFLPDTLPQKKTVPAGSPASPWYDSWSVTFGLAAVSDVTTARDIPALPIAPFNFDISIEVLSGAGVSANLHIGGGFIRLSSGVWTNAPWW